MSLTTAPWVPAACDHLFRLRGTKSGWGYRGAGPPYAEPTVLGSLALQATCDKRVESASLPLINASAQWLVDLQQDDGAVGVSRELPAPRWPTAFAALLWTQRTDPTEPTRFQKPLERALDWLLKRNGVTFPKASDGVLGHDTSIPGWPWVVGTHPWLEPTAISMLVLCLNGLTTHPRAQDGVRMILDRAIESGGWNMGNSTVFGHALRPQAGPTGMALLALRAARHTRSDRVSKGCHYLLKTLPMTRSPESLGWGLLGLTAWNSRPPEAEQWLAESFHRAMALADSPTRLSMLLLAASTRSLALMGVAPAPQDLANRRTQRT